jgi:hypothetical protein
MRRFSSDDNGFSFRDRHTPACGAAFSQEVTRDSADRQQFESMEKAAKDELQQPQLNVTNDASYSNGEQFQACETPVSCHCLC